MFLPSFVIGWSKHQCDWSIYKKMWGYLRIPSSQDSSYFLFCTIFVWIPEGMDGPIKHETSARCRASWTVKQSTIDRDTSSMMSSWHENVLHTADPLWGESTSLLIQDFTMSTDGDRLMFSGNLFHGVGAVTVRDLLPEFWNQHLRGHRKGPVM